MDRKKLDILWEALVVARRSPQTADDLENLARMCGRRRRSGGKHPVWVSECFPHRPLPIERHGGNPSIPPHARSVILNGLEADAEARENLLTQAERQNKDGNGKDIMR